MADNAPRSSDSDNNLLTKICRILNGSAGTSQGDLPGDSVSVVGAEVVDPDSLPADGTVGTIRRLISDQKGILLVRLATTLDGANDSVSVTKTVGSPLIAASQVVTSTVAAQALSARATRRKVYVKNIDASVVIYIGHDNTVSSTTGFALAAGAVVELDTAAAIWAISASVTPRLSFIETYD